jgi:integrase
MANNGSRRPRGEGSIYWDDKRQRFLAAVTVGYTPAGKRIVRRGSGRTEAAARAKLKEVIREYEAGLTTKARNQTVRHAVEDWLAYGLHGRAQRTVDKDRILCQTHIISALGARKLRELTATDVDRWLADKAKSLSTRTLRELHQCLNRAINRATARDLVARNVVGLCGVPRGLVGRPSKSLDFDQAKALLQAAQSTVLYDAYVTVSLLTGARTEELRALTWDHVDLDGQPDADQPRPPSIDVWRSVREGGDTKTPKSRRTLALPARCVRALRRLREHQVAQGTWSAAGIVFASAAGTELDAANVRRAFRQVVARAGLNPADWTPRELRHSFVSLLSDHGVSIEKIADLVGHSGTTVTEKVYRHQLRPVLLTGTVVMDHIFDGTLPGPPPLPGPAKRSGPRR